MTTTSSRRRPLLRGAAVAAGLLALIGTASVATHVTGGAQAAAAPAASAGTAAGTGSAGQSPASTTAGTSAAGTSAAAVAVPRPAHTVVVVLENKDRTSVLGNPQAPYLNALAAQGASMTRSYGVTHPSQPNYVALFSGGQQGVTDDKCHDLGARANLGSQLRGAGLTFTGYAESLPRAGYTGCSAAGGDYRRKHNPWVDFSNLPASVNRPFSDFPTDFTTLPTVAFVTPDMCHDMHDCPVATGDAWVRTHLGAYATWARTHDSLLVVTFDENEGGTVNQITTLLVGQRVRPGQYPETTTHYTLLRTLEDAYGLAPLGQAAAATPLRTIWTTSPRPAAARLTNGGFESGLGHWVGSGATTGSTHYRHGGSRSARAGRTTATTGDSVLSQTITVPAGRSRLTVWWKGRCSDTVGKAWASVVVRRNTSGTTSTLLPRTCVRTGSWRKVGVAVNAGHSYTVRLVNHDDGVAATPNRTYFDDVTLS